VLVFQYFEIKRIDIPKLVASGQNINDEINILKHLHHPNIVEYYESFQNNNELCLVMEYVNGSTLRDFFKHHQPPLQESFIRKIICQLLSAVIYLHSMGIIHRDIKPENILLTDTFDIKLTDFGLSFLTDSIRNSPQSYTGTVDYMSPEMLQRKSYSFSTDIWSLGCVFLNF
jgi:serine/threonine protein kinase